MTTTLIAGASRGIGLELARQAAARGDSVIACARDPEAADLAALAAETGLARRALDVTDPDSCAALAAGLPAPVDLLICNAGVFLSRGGLDEAPYAPEDWERTFAVNVTGAFNTIRALRPAMARPGRIAVISSQMGSSERASGGSYIYRASKAAATNLACNLALDLKDEGLAVGAWHPGWVRTDMGGAQAAISPQESAAGLLARFETLTPETAGRFENYDGTPIPF